MYDTVNEWTEFMPKWAIWRRLNEGDKRWQTSYVYYTENGETINQKVKGCQQKSDSIFWSLKQLIS